MKTSIVFALLFSSACVAAADVWHPKESDFKSWFAGHPEPDTQNLHQFVRDIATQTYKFADSFLASSRGLENTLGFWANQIRQSLSSPAENSTVRDAISDVIRRIETEEGVTRSRMLERKPQLDGSFHPYGNEFACAVMLIKFHALARSYPYFRWFPQPVVTLIPDMPPKTWAGPDCFEQTSGFVKRVGTAAFNVSLTFEKPRSLLCADTYLLMTGEGVSLKTQFFSGTNQFRWALDASSTEADLWDITTNGIRVFRFLDSPLQLLVDLLDTALLFEPELTQGVSQSAADENLYFLRNYAKVDMQARSVNLVNISEAEVHSGDFLGVIRLDGLDPMLAWAMGSTTGHTTVALWIDGELYICESTVKDSYWPTNGIQKTPFRVWLQQAYEAGYNVVHAPLSPESRSKFNTTAAIHFFESVEGFQYGYHNLLFGWLDTVHDNYPCLPPDYTSCLTWEFLMPAVSLLDRLIPSVTDLLFNQAWNLRLGTSGLRSSEIFYESFKQNIDPAVLSTLVEKDTYVYNTTRYNVSMPGPSMVCCVFVCHTWKAAGLFSDMDDEINCAELTNWDDYSMAIFDQHYQRPDACVQADPHNPLCQLVGDYTLQLNNYNSKTPYPFMAEHCPSEAPNYLKPANC